ncbi:MAG TPA: alpha/beta fold hydrolase [Acidimicrobiia bacterium]
MVDELIDLETGMRVHYRRVGAGEPLLLAMGTAASLGMWMPVEGALADRFDVVSFDYRGLGDSARGDDAITAARLASDARALLDALSIPRAHVLGWSLGSVVAQELAVGHPDRVASLVLYGTWARRDGVMTALLTALKYPWEKGDLATALTTLGVVYSAEFLASSEFHEFLEWTTPLAPSTPEQIRTVAEQWQADLDFDGLDRLGSIAAPTLALTGEHDIVIPPRHGRQVAERIPGATFELMTGTGASHGLMFERTEDFLRTVLTFVDQHPLA